MAISQKCQYALRALLELADHGGKQRVTIAAIAQAQSIPPRFLEVILSELRQGGFVTARRGPRGGYRIAVAPGELSVGRVVRFIDGPLDPVQCFQDGKHGCGAETRCPFSEIWEQVHQAVAGVLDAATLQNVLDRRGDRAAKAADYTI